MQTTTIELSKAFNEIELHFLSDDHTGDEHSDVKLIRERIESIRDTPNAYAILNGDEINNAVANSKSDIYSEVFSPTESIQYAADLYKPIKDKILAIIPGNHTARSWKSVGVDPTRMFALELGIPDKYSSEPLLLFIRLGSNSRRASEGRPVTYMVYVAHGTGGGKKPGSKLGRIYDLASIVDADLYVTGHVHTPGVYKIDYFRTFPATGGVVQTTKTFVSTASALTYGGYGSVGGFPPSCKTNPIVYLSGQKKEVTVSL